MNVFDEQVFQILNKAIISITSGYATKVQYSDRVIIYKVPGKSDREYIIRIDLKVGEEK